MGHFIIGKEASFSYASGPEVAGGTIAVTFTRIAYKFSRRMFKATPDDYEMDSFLPGILSASGFIGDGIFRSSDALSESFPPPGGDGPPDNTTVGTLSIIAISGKFYQFKASLIELDGASNGLEGGPPQLFQYAFIGNAQAFTDTIAITG